MQRVNSAIVFFLFTAMIGCSAHLSESPQEQEASRVKQEKDRNPSSLLRIAQVLAYSLMGIEEVYSTVYAAVFSTVQLVHLYANR